MQNPENFPLRGYRGLGNTSYNYYLLKDSENQPTGTGSLYDGGGGGVSGES